MFAWFESEKKFAFKLFGLFLAVVLVLGVNGYYAALGSDPYGMVHFAKDLSRGKFFSDYPVYKWFKPEWKAGEAHFVLLGNYLAEEDRMYCKYAIGYPLVLALSIRLFGLDSVYFLNIFILLILLWFYFKLGREIFTFRSHRWLLAGIAPILLILMINKIWSQAIKPTRDLAALMFLITGLFLGIRALRSLPRINYFYLLFGALCIGFSGNIRLPNVLAGIPAGLYLLGKLARQVPFKKLVAALILTAVFFVLALTPVFVQNTLTSGSPFKPPRPEIVDREPLNVKKDEVSPPPFSPPPWWPGFFPTTFPDTVKYFRELYGPLLITLIIIGLVVSWKSPEIRYLCFGIPLLFILFYSMWVHLMVRYMMIAQPFLILLATSGLGKLFETRKLRWWVLVLGPVLIAADFWLRVRWRQEYGIQNIDILILILGVSLWILIGWPRKTESAPARLSVLSLIIFGLFLAKLVPVSLGGWGVFQLPEARRFGRDFNRLVEKDSVVFATKPVAQYIALFTHSYNLRPFDIERMGVDLEEGCRRILGRGTSLYLIDNSGGRRDAGIWIPVLREYFNLTPVGKLKGDKYFLTKKFGKPVCTVYKIEPWKEKEVEFNFAVPDRGDGCLLTLNARKIWDEEGGRQWVKLKLNSNPLKGELNNGINFLYLPAELLDSPRFRLAVSSDLPLARDMDVMVQNIRVPYKINLGKGTEVPDDFYISGFKAMHWQDKYYRRLAWNQPGKVTIPTIVLPHTQLIGEICVRNGQKIPRPVNLLVKLNGEEITDLDLSRVGNWERIRFLLPAQAIKSARSELEFFAYPRKGYQIPSADVWWGALSFDEVRIKRWLTKAFLDTPEKSHYFLAFIIRPDSGSEPCSGPFQVLINQKMVSEGMRKGVQKLLLKPEEVKIPVSELEVLSSIQDCRTLLQTRPLLWGPGSEIFMDVGSEQDWAFIEDGFYQREKHLGKTSVRWTKQTAKLVVPVFPRKAQKLVLSLRVINERPQLPDLPELKVKVMLNQNVLGEISVPEGGRTYQWTLPGELAEPQIALLTITTPTWRPSFYLPVKDHRDLGIMLDWVKIFSEEKF